MPDEPDMLNYASPAGDPRLRRVYGARDGTEAEFVRMLLGQAGVEAVIEGAATNAVLGSVLGSLAAASVWVREESLEQAREVVARFRRGEVEQGEAWTCPNCGEAIEGQFTECWNCGTARGANVQPRPAIPLSGDALDYEAERADDDPELGWQGERSGQQHDDDETG